MNGPLQQLVPQHTLKLRPFFKISDHLLNLVPMDSYRSSDTRKVVFEIGKTPAHGQNCNLNSFYKAKSDFWQVNLGHHKNESYSPYPTCIIIFLFEHLKIIRKLMAEVAFY